MIPKSLRLEAKRMQRLCTDTVRGTSSKFARRLVKDQQFDFALPLTQEIKKTSTSVQKIQNIELAFQGIKNVVIFPGEIFSFWALVKKPNKKNGFQKGRNLISGELIEDYGGGLCQLSGIIYHLSLLSGLAILERHNHTLDLYTEEARYTPLGSDATVVYGYKDLRVRNDYDFPITFDYEIDPQSLTLKLLSSMEIREREITFKKTTFEETIEVKTLWDGKEIVPRSRYGIA